MSTATDFTPAQNASTDGEFVRDATYINDRVVADVPAGSDPVGEKIGEMRWPVEAGRYRLMAARACPWASRSIIVRRLMGLEDAISLGLAGPTHDINSWVFDLDPDEGLGFDTVKAAAFQFRDRLAARFNGMARLECGNGPDGGYCVRLTLPLVRHG